MRDIIVELDDQPSGPVRPRGDRLVIGALFGACVAFGVGVWLAHPAARPAPDLQASPPRVAIAPPLLRGPSLLADLRPVPVLNLAFPDGVASLLRRSGIDGETGLIPSAAAITTFRLDATGDVVTVSSLPDAGPIGLTRSDSGLRVHGQVAVGSVDRGIAHVRWTADGVTYDIASRTLLDVARLTEVAQQLR